MIARIKNKIKEFEERFRKVDLKNEKNTSYLETIRSGQQITYDYIQLSQLFSQNEFIPLTKLSLSPSAVLHILNDIYFNDRKNIIEFGSGSSTFYIAKFLKNLELKVQFCCIESDKVWLEKMEKLLAKYEISEYVNLIYAPLQEVKEKYSFEKQLKWYDDDKIRENLDFTLPFDLIVVDGPVGNSSPYARYSAIPFLIEFMSKNPSVFLDDTFRKEESEILKKWQELLKLQVKHFNKYSLMANEQIYKVQPFILNQWQIT